MAKECPGNVAVFQLVDRNLASESSVGLVENILGSDFESWIEVLASKEEVEGRRSNDDFCKSFR